jgi:hypothetical protein
VALGSNCRHNCDRYLHIINPSAIYGAIAERETGQYISFSSSSGTYTTDPDLDYTLTKSGSTWTLTDPDDTVEVYSQSGAEATLQSITRRTCPTCTGYRQTPLYERKAHFRHRYLWPHAWPVLFIRGFAGDRHDTRRADLRLRLCRLFERRASALDRHLQHQPFDASDLRKPSV